jgi:hypothetical protein
MHTLLLLNSKHEIRNSKQIQNSNFQMSKTSVGGCPFLHFRHLNFVIHCPASFRASDSEFASEHFDCLVWYTRPVNNSSGKWTPLHGEFNLDLPFAQFYIMIFNRRSKAGFEFWSFGIRIWFGFRYSNFEFKADRQTIRCSFVHIKTGPNPTVGANRWTLQPSPWKSPMKPT